MALRYILGVRRKTYWVLDFITGRLCLIYYNFHSLTRLFGLFRRYIQIWNMTCFTCKVCGNAQKVLGRKTNGVSLNAIKDSNIRNVRNSLGKIRWRHGLHKRKQKSLKVIKICKGMEVRNDFDSSEEKDKACNDVIYMTQMVVI